jgi:hypothetical protein
VQAETRETILFFAGLVAFFVCLWAAIAREWDVQWSILVIIAGMIGLPAVLPKDRHREALRPDPPSDNPLPAGGPGDSISGAGS